MSDLEWKKLSEVVELVIDNRGRNPKAYTNEGVPVIDNYLITSDGEANLGEVNRYIDEETYNSFLRKYIAEGDVLMTLVGNGYGKVAATPKERCAIIQNTIGLRCNKDNSNQFLYYLLRNNRESLMNLNRGAAQPSIKVGDVLNLEFSFPPVDRQNRIASILRVIDNKIKLNRQTNQTLEQIAQAIFKSWFVDFEPVKAKIEAKQNGQDTERAAMRAIIGKTDEELEQLSPEQHQQLSTTAALFPDELEDSELGEVPKGWKVKPLDKIANYLNGLALQKFPANEGEESLPVLKIAQLKKGDTFGADRAAKNIKSDYIIENGDVVFSWSGSLFIDIWCGGQCALNQHLFKVTSDEYPKWFYYFWTKYHLAEFQRIAADKAVTMGHIKRGHLSSAKCLVPDEKLIHSLGEYISALVDLSVERRLENINLADIRDSLLPKLLSGEISLNDKQLAEEAVA